MVRRSMSKGGGTPKGHKGTTASSRRPPPQTIQASLVQQQQRLLGGGSTEHNNNTKSNPATTNSNNPAATSSVVVVPQALNNKQGISHQQPQSTQQAPPPPPSSQQLPIKQAAVVGKSMKDTKNPQGQQQHLLEGMSPSSQVASTIPPAPSSSPVAGEGEDDLVDVDELEVDVDDVDEDLEDEDEDDDLEDEDEDDEDLEEDDEYDHEDGHDDLTEPCESRTPGAPSGGLTNNNSASSYNNSPNFGSSSEEDDDDEGEVDESLDRDESEDDDEEDDEDGLEPSGFLLPPDGDPCSQSIPPDAQARLEAFFEAAGFTDGKLMSDPENLRKLTLTVSSALGEASAAINRMRDSQRKSIEEGRNDSMEEGDSLLALACSSGYFELARVLLAMGASVDDRGNKGDLTPLMDAASQGHLEIVKLLISHGADVNAQSACGNSPLMYACSSGHEDIVKELLNAGARVEDNNENGHTPLMEAASSGHVSVAKILLEHGAGINTHSNEFKESALTVACYKGHLEMVRFLLDAGADQQHKTDEMHTALMEASMDGHVEVAKLLLESGAQVNMPADSFESPLTLAACGGHVELAELLISRGANIEEVNDEGYTPLMEAAREGHLAVVKCLLKAGAKINAETEETHETALTLSACGGFLDVVDTLCHHGADIEAGASTPLMEAAQEGHFQVVKYLLDRGADITRETQTGDTALSYACENGHVDVVDLLVSKGANHEHQSEGGRTPLMKACRGGHVDVIKFLLSKGADINRQTASNDHTPLSLACAGGHISAVEVLLTSGANLFHKLKDNSTMLIEAARGGHTNVMKILLDFAPCKQGDGPAAPPPPPNKAQQAPGGKVTTKGVQQSLKGQQQQQAVDSSKINANQNHGKAALKKSRSVSSMIDSCALQKQVEANGNVVNKPTPPTAIKTLPESNNQVPLLPTDTTQGSKNQNLNAVNVVSLADGKNIVATDLKKPGVLVPVVPTSIESNKTTSPTAGGAPGGNRKTATPSIISTQQQQQPVGPMTNTTTGAATTGGSVCSECNKSDGHPHPHGVHVKRAAMEQPGTAGTAGTTTSSSTGPPPTTTTGPPLVPSQVTAATAISERPKAKANKPSARKQVQALQIQQTLAVQEAMRIEQQRLAAMRQQQQQQQKGSSSSTTSVVEPPVMISPGGTAPVGGGGTGTGGGNASTLVQSSPAAVLSPSSPGGASPGSVSGSITSKNPCCGGVLAGSGIMAVGGSGNNNDFSINRLVAAAAASGGGGHVVNNSSGLKLSAPPGPSPPFVPGPVVQMQVSQIFTQHHLRGSGGTAKFVDCYDGLSNYDATTGDHLLEYTQVMGGGPGGAYPVAVSPGGTPLLGSTTTTQLLPSSSSPGNNGASGTTTTTTTTTVVVTHGNGETQTIIDGEGTANAEMIFNAAAAAAAFPINYALPDMQLQSYQLTAGGVPVVVPPSNDLACLPPASPLTATMHTTIINSGGPSTINNNNTNAFQPQILLPHPPTGVPTATNPPTQANVNNNNTFITPSQQDQGTTMSQRHHPPQVMNKKQAGVQVVREKIVTTTSTSTGKAVSTQATQVTTTSLPAGPMKKQTAKRSRSFAPANQQAHGGACTNNQKGVNGSHSVASTQTGTGTEKTIRVLDIDSATDSNGETSLTVAALQGHFEVCEFLLSRKAHIEHRDKKGCTPLILAADGGHEKVVELLLNHGADIEAQSERTKDTALSLACTKGRFEVVDLLIKRGANKEHRNVSDYTPLSLAASGGFVNIITLLLRSGAEINSRTGSKLGISPLMLAAMNGNTAAVKLLLDQGSDINAQIETNKNTALTLACFQGRHEVVQLLLERKANLEHRAKTGLTPLMEAANGGYVDVGRVLIEKGADVNAAPVPATRDTALTIAADKGHYRFVELLLQHNANVEVRNKKGCTPMWLACNGGHLDVCQGLQKHRADVDAQDNRKISCLMAAFKKGHVKVVRWIVRYVKQFPNDQEMSRYFVSLQAEPELLKRAQQCAEFIKQAKDKQALEASKNANILLEELELEKCREESKRLQAAKRREKKKKKKMEKKQQYPQNDDNDDDRDDDGDDEDEIEDETGVLDMIDNGLDDLTIQEISIAEGRNKKSKGNKGNKENQAVIHQQVNSKQRQSKQSSIVESEVVIPPEPVKNSEPPSNNKSSKKKKNKGGNNAAANESSPEPQPTPVPPTPAQVESTVLPQSKKNVEKENLKGNKNAQHAGHGKSEKDVLKEKVKEVEENEKGGKKKDKKEDQKKKDDSQSNKKEAKGSGTGKGGKGDFQQPEPLMGLSLNHPHQMRKGYGSDHETSSSTHNTNTSANSNGNTMITSPSSVTTITPITGTSPGKSTALPSSLSSPSGVANNSTSSLAPNASPGVPISPGNATNKPGGALGRKDDGWKEVTRSCTSSRSKKVIVPSSVISRVIGRGGCNINAIREHTGAHIEVEKQQKGALQPERTIQIKGSADATREAHSLITTLMSEPDADIKKLIARLGPKIPCSSSASVTGLGGVLGSTAVGTGTNTSGSASSSCAGSTAGGRVTPNILNSASAFPVIGSASAPLPPIGQIMTVGSTSSTTSPPTSSLAQAPASSSVSSSSTTVPVDIVNNTKSSTYTNRNGGGPKGSNARHNAMSVSPPMKNGSPPLKKPIAVNNNSASTFEIGNFSISEANAETYNNTKNSSTYTSYGKRSMVFTPSVSASSNQAAVTTNTNSSVGSVTSSSFSSKHNQHQQHHHSSDSHSNMDNRDLNWDGSVRQQRTVTPTVNHPMVGGKKTPTSIGSGGYIAAGGSSRSSTPPVAPTHQNAPATNGNVSHSKTPGRQIPQQQHLNNQPNVVDRQQQIPNVLHSMVQNFGSGGAERNPSKEIDSINVNGPVGDPSSGFANVPRNLAPGSGNSSQVPTNAIGSNRGANSTGSERSPSESGASDQQQPAPLEYSPFNYQFSKTTGWYPGDLAVRDNSSANVNQQPMGNFGSGNLISSLGGSTSSLNASRAMNFASVAASGISSSSMSTTTAQMSTASIGGVPNGPVGGIVSIGGPKVSDGRDSEIEPKTADASKAPGYRGNTTMGSPILRMQQQQQQPNYGMDSPGGFGVPGGMNMMGSYGVGPRQQQQQSGYGVPSNQFQSQEMLNHPGMGDGNHMMYQNNSGGTVGPPPPPPVVPPPSVPTNVVLSSRLNPRAPSFMAKVSPGSGQQQPGHQIPPPGSNAASAFASTQQQQNQFNSIPQQYKSQQQQFGSRPVGGAIGMGNNSRNVAGGWAGSGGYGGGSMGNGNLVDEQMGAYPGLVNLVSGDPSLLVTNVATLERMQGMHDPQGLKMEERRLVRSVGAIGAERNYNKVGSGAGGVGNVLGPYSLDTLEGPLNQPGGGGGNGGVNSWAGPSPVGGLVGMYGGAPTPPATSQQGPPIHGGLGGSHGPPPGPHQGGPPRGNDRLGTNAYGRRIMDDLDATRMFELQQQLQYDGQSRMMNGGGVPPMMHLPNAPPPNAHMYPFGLEHMEQHNMPKLDQSWDAQMLMDEKHMQGWNAATNFWK